MGDTCGGCLYHKFPYEAKPPILIDGSYKPINFKSKEDVWNIIDLLIKEVNDVNEKGKEFDVVQSINAQLPFFTCVNHIFDKDIQKDIQRYIYCTSVNVPPYKGEYNKQPARWVDTFWIIKKTFAKKEKMEISKVKNKGKNG
tara:strand:+ start:138 stop:563 length:426 start_codon:yes stop_codon:yes gene_type:complete